MSRERPLPPPWFQILLALADRDLHGLDIVKEVFRRTDGHLHLWPGKLYGALKKMHAAGLVIDAPLPDHFKTAGGRPRFYRISAAGRRALAAEAATLAALVDAARSKRHLRRP